MKQNQNQMPILFAGHGSPTNIIAKNAFSFAMNELGKTITPKAIICISAHWFDDSLIEQIKTLKIDNLKS